MTPVISICYSRDCECDNRGGAIYDETHLRTETLTSNGSKTMAATQSAPPAQPMFLPSGTAPMAPMPVSAAPGSVMYYPQASGGGAVIMVSVH